jgi:hypothetical protein
MLTTNQKGAVAEAAIAKAPTELGIGVYRPMATNAAISSSTSAFGSCASNASGRHETAMSSPSVFTPRGGLENSELAATTTVLLRVEAAKNNQAAGIRWARDYEFGATLGRLAGP